MKAAVIRLLKMMPLDERYDGFVERAENWVWWTETADRKTVEAERRRVWGNSAELRRIIKAPARSRADQIVQAITRLILGWLTTPPRGDEPRTTRSSRILDARGLIRESRAFEATTGPARPAINENGPSGDKTEGPISLVAVDRKPTATLPASLKFSTGISPAVDSCAQNLGADGDAHLEPEGVADDDSRKSRH